PLALGSADHDLGLDGGAYGREVLGGIGLAERAADGAAVAHDRVGDHVLGVAEDRVVLGQQLGLEEIDVARQGSDPDLAALLPDELELGQIVDVDQVLGIRQPELHHRQQAVTTRDDARLRTKPLQGGDRSLQTRRTLVLECRRGLQHVLLLKSAERSWWSTQLYEVSLRSRFRFRWGRCAAACARAGVGEAPRCPRAARTGPARRCRSRASAAAPAAPIGGPPDTAVAQRGCPPRRSAARGRPGWPWRSAPRGRAGRG